MFNLVFLWLKSRSNGAPPPDLLFFPDESTLRACIDALGPEGRAHYSVFFVVDMFYPISYGLFLSALVSRTCWLPQPTASAWKHLTALPLVAMVADWTENICHRLIIANWPMEDAPIFVVERLANATKWVAICASLLVIMSGVMVWIRRRLDG